MLNKKRIILIIKLNEFIKCVWLDVKGDDRILCSILQWLRVYMDLHCIVDYKCLLFVVRHNFASIRSKKKHRRHYRFIDFRKNVRKIEILGLTFVCLLYAICGSKEEKKCFSLFSSESNGTNFDVCKFVQFLWLNQVIWTAINIIKQASLFVRMPKTR